MKLKHICVLCLCIIGCRKNPEQYINYINGYWEIEKVMLHNGNEKVYTYNETVDYIKINDSLKGFRKKLKPLFNNSYVATKDAEGITAKIENDSLHLYYKTPYMAWKETILLADEDKLKVINTNKDVYLYKRFTGLQLDTE